MYIVSYIDKLYMCHSKTWSCHELTKYMNDLNIAKFLCDNCWVKGGYPYRLEQKEAKN